MYSAEISKLDNFQDFLNLMDVEWLTVLATKSKILLMQKTNEIIAIFQLPCVRGDGDVDEVFRVKKSVIKVGALEGRIDMIVKPEQVYFDFNGKRSLTTVKHAEFISNVQDSLAIFSGAGMSEPFNAMCLKKIAAISRVFGSFVEVNNGTACTVARDTTRVYCKADLPCFSLSNAAINTLFKCNYLWSTYKHYVCAVNGQFALAVTQCRGSGATNDLAAVKNSSNSAVVKHINFADISKVASKLKDAEINYDFRNDKCDIVAGDDVFRINVETMFSTIEDWYKAETINLNRRVICDLLTKMDSTQATFEKKQYFNIMIVDDFTFVFK